MRFLYPVLLIASVWILLRGHNAPGGGFIAGLLAVGASAAYALVFDAAAALRKLPLAPPLLAGCGVLLSLLSGLPAVWKGQAFLTHPWATLQAGLFKIPLSTVMLFVLGVYLAVWGALGGYCLTLIQSSEETS